ncbi:MAG: AI-2E family transporter [Comamonadaceae bacterium]|nr:AI-2E family transporter [Comamonadaceae bacterium]
MVATGGQLNHRADPQPVGLPDHPDLSILPAGRHAAVDGLAEGAAAAALRDQLGLLATEFDEVLSGFVQGRLLVCAILAVLYSAGLAAIGIDLAVVIGTLSGAAFIIPYLGTMLGIVLSMLMALLKFHDLLHPLLCLGWFALVQGLEDRDHPQGGGRHGWPAPDRHGGALDRRTTTGHRQRAAGDTGGGDPQGAGRPSADLLPLFSVLSRQLRWSAW